MTTFIDNSNLEAVINTLKWLKVFLNMISERTQSNVTLLHFIISDIHIIGVFEKDSKPYSLRMDITNSLRIMNQEFLVTNADPKTVVVTYEQLINWKIPNF